METDPKPLIETLSEPLLKAPKYLQSLLLALQNYNLRVNYKLRPEILVNNTLSRVVTCSALPDAAQVEHTVCGMGGEQLAIEPIDMTDYLKISDRRLLQKQQHTDNDSQLQAAKATILQGWPVDKDETVSRRE